MGRPRIPRAEQRERMRALDRASRTRPLLDAETRELERLLHADYCSRIRRNQPIPRGVG